MFNAKKCVFGAGARIALSFCIQGFSTSEYPVGADSRAVAVVDLDGDGTQDLLVPCHGPGKIHVLRGFPSTGEFGPTFSVFTAAGPVGLVTADFNADGRVDFATANDTSSTVSLAAGRGDGTFFSALGFQGKPFARALAVADMDGDGLPDVVVAHENSNATLTWMRVYLAPNADFPTGWEPVLEPAATLSSGFEASTVVAADLDANGTADLVVGDLSNNAARIFLGDGHGRVVAGAVLEGVAQPRGIVLKDLNADGLLDIVAPESGSATIAVFRGLGGASFAAAQRFEAGIAPIRVEVTDVTGDQKLDLAVLRENGGLAILAGVGPIQFASPVAVPEAGTNLSGVASVDANGDFLTDLIVTDAMNAKVRVLTSEIGPWIELGGEVVGAQGPVTLTASGVPKAGTLVSLTASGPSLLGPGVLVGGLSKIAIPFQGGVLVPTPTVILPVAAGVPLSFTWPAIEPGSSVYLQAWFGAFAPTGASASSALRAVVQFP